MLNLTIIAQNFAFYKHRNQMYDKTKNLSYSYHLREVAQFVINYGEIAIAGAYMHDIIEDTNVTKESLTEYLIQELSKLSEEQLAYLAFLTFNQDKNGKKRIKTISAFISEVIYLVSDEEGENRKERKKKTNEKLASVEEQYYIALVIKAADRLANMSFSFHNNNKGMMKMYYKEYADFKKAAYREGLADDIWSELDKIYDFIGNLLNY